MVAPEPSSSSERNARSDVSMLASTSDAAYIKDISVSGGSAQTESLFGKLWADGLICCSSAAFIFAGNALLVKLLGGRVPTSEVVMIRSMVSLGLCIAAHRASGTDSPFYGQPENLPLLLMRGVFGAATMQTFYLAIFMLPLADAVTLFYCNPTVTTLAAFLLLGESISMLGVGGILGSIIGLVILTQPPFIFGGAPWDVVRTTGTSYGVLSALCAAGTFISIRKIGDKEPTLVVSNWFHTVSLVSAVVPLALGSLGVLKDPAVLPTLEDGGLLVGVGLTSFAGQMVLSRGFQLLPAAKASAINVTQVVWSYIFGAFFLHDHVTLTGAIGSSMICAGAIVVNLKARKHTDEVTGLLKTDSYDSDHLEDPGDIAVAYKSMDAIHSKDVPSITALLSGWSEASEARAAAGNRDVQAKGVAAAAPAVRPRNLFAGCRLPAALSRPALRSFAPRLRAPITSASAAPRPVR